MSHWIKEYNLRYVVIKFFRKIRQQLLTENKFSKYLLYAIGEIVLVVIGILIALSINNWNHERIESQKELVYLDNLERDLQNQLISIDVQLGYEQKYIEYGEPILEDYLETDGIVFDTVFSTNLRVLMERKTFVRTDPTFEDLISSGNIGVLKNNGLRNDIIEYYQELERVEKVIQNNNTLLIDQAYGQRITDLVYVGTFGSDRLINISNELLKDPEREMKFINLVGNRTGIANNHVGTMNDLRKKTTEIIQLMQKSRL
ncbi:MAG: hypothetical protein ACI8XB_000503 [Patiriisocius sp.]